MQTVPMKPIVFLKCGDEICPRLVVDRNKVANWKYADECPAYFSALMPGVRLPIFELSSTPGAAWVKAYLPSSHQSMYLKIAGEELSWNFLLVREAPAFDIEASVKHLVKNAAGREPTGKCAAHVRAALEAGGLDMRSHPVSAKDYGSFLLQKGFRNVPLNGYQPRKGDIIVLQSYPGGDVNGHIAMFDGVRWVSDFEQRDLWGGPGYRNQSPHYAVYRP